MKNVMKNKNYKDGYDFADLIEMAGYLLTPAVYVCIIYVAYHFIYKFW